MYLNVARLDFKIIFSLKSFGQKTKKLAYLQILSCFLMKEIDDLDYNIGGFVIIVATSTFEGRLKIILSCSVYKNIMLSILCPISVDVFLFPRSEHYKNNSFLAHSRAPMRKQ